MVERGGALEPRPAWRQGAGCESGGRGSREGTAGAAAGGRTSLSSSTADSRCGRAAWGRPVRWAGEPAARGAYPKGGGRSSLTSRGVAASDCASRLRPPKGGPSVRRAAAGPCGRWAGGIAPRGAGDGAVGSGHPGAELRCPQALELRKRTGQVGCGGACLPGGLGIRFWQTRPGGSVEAARTAPCGCGLQFQPKDGVDATTWTGPHEDHGGGGRGTREGWVCDQAA